MGLKKQNAEFKDVGIVLTNAYAVVKNIRISGDGAVADFAINISRSNAMNCSPIKELSVSFTVDRNKDIYKQAYEAAKRKIKRTEYVKDESGKIKPVIKEVNSFFTDWEDDIVINNTI